MSEDSVYDCAVIGGGLAGLALSIQLARQGFTAIVFEKERYPFHKVCGEYISLESFDFLRQLGLPLEDWNLPVMKRLKVSAPNGKGFLQPLPLGGFGVSRYKLDAAMALIAKHCGVEIREQAKVNEVQYRSDLFCIDTNNSRFNAAVCCGAFGKRSNLDVKWKRGFVQKKAGALDNYIGVKYHAHIDQPKDIIALHNFKNGYCGISAIEEDKYCICYLTTAVNLRDNYNDIKRMEEALLFKNPHLKEIFTTANFLYKEPLAISQISFDKKQQVENHILMAGDAAGMITPLCGNGMSMALHAGKLAAQCITDFLQGNTDRAAMEARYRQQWKYLFGSRLRAGRVIQRLFGNEQAANLFIQAIRPFPGAVRLLARQTHGHAF